MPLPPPHPDSTALVTGASAGIGVELARGLARRGHGVTLVARRRERLEELAAELSGAHGVRAECVPADLTVEEERDGLEQEIASRGLTVEVLVNNAGFGVYSPFAGNEREKELRQVRLLVEAVVDLGARYLPGMIERGRGAILNMSSTSGFQPLPGNAGYAAAKSYVLFHSEALSEEVRGTGVTVTAICPGPVRTEFQEVGEPAFMDKFPQSLWREAAPVAEESLQAAEKGRRSVIPGGLAIRAAFGPNRLAPAALALPVARWVMSGELERGR